MAAVICPPDGTAVFPDAPTIFLAGPIKGAPRWQTEAFNIILRDGPAKLNVANPRRDYKDDEFDYNTQVQWETDWLYAAGKNGVIMFWLAKEDHEVDGRAYGQTTRFELGEWFGRAQFIGPIPEMPKIVVGIEDGFPGGKYIRLRIESLLSEYIPVLDNLEDTCAAAIEKLRYA